MSTRLGCMSIGDSSAKYLALEVFFRPATRARPQSQVENAINHQAKKALTHHIGSNQRATKLYAALRLTAIRATIKNVYTRQRGSSAFLECAAAKADPLNLTAQVASGGHVWPK